MTWTWVSEHGGQDIPAFFTAAGSVAAAQTLRRQSGVCADEKGGGQCCRHGDKADGVKCDCGCASVVVRGVREVRA